MKKGEFNTPIRERYIYRDKHSKKNPNLKKKNTSHLQIRHFEMKERRVLKALFTINKHYYRNGNSALCTLSRKNESESEIQI